MKTGLSITYRCLAKTRNAAAVDVLVDGLDYQDQAIRHQALRALLERRDSRGHAAVFQRLTSFDDEARSIVTERPERLVAVISHILEDDDPAACKKAFETILAFRLYDAMPALVDLLKDSDFTDIEGLSETILELTEEFYKELGSPEGSGKLKQIDTVRGRIIASLEQAVGRFTTHGSPAVVEAFLLVTKISNVSLRRILQQLHESAHKPVVDALTNSERGGVMRLLMGFLEDPQMPNAVLQVIAGRTDEKFLENFLRGLAERIPKPVGEALTRFKSFAWAEPKNEALLALDETCQGSAVRMLMATTINRTKLCDLFGFLLVNGNVGGRRAAAKALAEFDGHEATAHVVRGLSDEDSTVRAHVLKQLRPRNVPKAMLLLLRMIDHPDPIVRDALREALPEFTCRHFIRNFDSIPEGMRPTIGQMARQIDDECEPLLVEELTCLSPVRRRRAVFVAAATGMIGSLEKLVIRLLNEDDDHMVRIAAATALAECGTLPSWEALRDALLDKSPIVQEAAEQSLLQIGAALGQEDEESDGDQESETAQQTEAQTAPSEQPEVLQ